jgi:hypothetical protein
MILKLKVLLKVVAESRVDTTGEISKYTICDTVGKIDSAMRG